MIGERSDMLPSEIEGADIILKQCGRLKSSETIAVICDTTTRSLGELLTSRAKLITNDVRPFEIPPASMHGEEPPEYVADEMRRVSLAVGVTAKSMAHTRARREAALAGCRYLSLPDYSLQLIADPSLRVDYASKAEDAKTVSEIFTRGKIIRVTSSAGTDITMRIDGRIGNCCPGFVSGPGELGSPPDIEANVSPIETSAEGVVVVDGSIPFPSLGLLSEPAVLVVRGGMIVQFEGPEATVVELKRLFGRVGSEKAYVLAECGVGLNDRARLTGVMLTDEGAAGTMHFGFGSNSTVGGRNEVPFHLDFVFKTPSMTVDDIKVLEEGALCIRSRH